MLVQITYFLGIYEISGLLNFQIGESLKNHFEALIVHSKGIVLSLNKVLDIDNISVNIISDLDRRAQLSDKLFFIIGKENQKVKELFSALKYYDILL